ncbi:MAG: hypothetical protein FJ098_04365 [Deltaproteobacteria bacterium]|nr:hypothetical protein [Deltaproteobacteria bacterium]
MTTALAAEAGSARFLSDAMETLREFLGSVQRPRLADAQWVQAAQERCVELQQRFTDARHAFALRSQSLAESMDGMVEGLRDWSREICEHAQARRLRGSAEALFDQYEALVNATRAWMEEVTLAAEPPLNLKPSNYARNVFHVSMGLFALFAYEVLFSWATCAWITVGLTATALLLETLRRRMPLFNAFLVKRVFGAVARPREMYRVNGSTWYLLAILTVLVAFPMRAAELGVLILALADPAATLAGKRWGRRRLWRDKSVVGAAAFFATAFVLTFGFAALVTGFPGGLARPLFALVIATAGTLAEVFTERLDDNFTIPVLCAGLATLWITG